MTSRIPNEMRARLQRQLQAAHLARDYEWIACVVQRIAKLEQALRERAR
jgi:hypothetical protein